MFAVPTHFLEQFTGASLHIAQTNRAPGLLTSRALNKMIASAAKACQRNTVQGIGESAGFWFLFLVSGSNPAQVSGFDRDGPFEAETLNRNLESTNLVCGFK